MPGGYLGLGQLSLLSLKKSLMCNMTTETLLSNITKSSRIWFLEEKKEKKKKEKDKEKGQRKKKRNRLMKTE